MKRNGDQMKGNEYADLVAAYLAHNYGERGLDVFREVSLGKSIIGKNRRIDIFVRDRNTNRVLALECKYQSVSGTADEKLPYALQDLQALHVPAFVVYAGGGFSAGVVHLLQGSPQAAACIPEPSLLPSKDTLELDHAVATTFGFWEAVLKSKKKFDIEAWRVARNG